MVAMGHVDRLSYETVRQVLKNETKPWLKEMWRIPPQQSAEFAAAMEDVPACTSAVRPGVPAGLPDETSKQLVGEVREPLPMGPGQPGRYDSEYVRHGTANLFMATEPLAGWRHLAVTDARKRTDFAHFVRDLVDGRYRDAAKVVLVMDNLKHALARQLVRGVAPAEAKRVADRLEIHYTPKHGSWLNMAEIELGVLGRQCLDRRIADQATLAAEVAAWESARNAAAPKIDWRFTTADARIKLKTPIPGSRMMDY